VNRGSGSVPFSLGKSGAEILALLRQQENCFSIHSMDPTPQWIVLAHILRPQGRKGEVLADLLTDFPERFASRPDVFLRTGGRDAPGGGVADRDTGAQPEPARVGSHWLPVGRNAGRVVLHFAGVDGIEQAERLAGKQVVVPREERTALEPGAAYVSDLIGCTVYDRGKALGVVDSVQFPTTPDGSRRLAEAAPLLAVASPEGDELLVPFVRAFLVKVDLGARSIRMELPEGLAEINRSSALPAAEN
jgi:16S rRNA processing protein RimM